MLTQLCLNRFKKIKDTTVQFAPFTVMMGENSSGKTTVLQATNLALQSLGRLRLVYDDNAGLPKVRRKGVGLAALPGMSLADYRELYYGKISRGGTTLGAGGADIELTDHHKDIYKLQITSLFGGSFNIKCTSTAADIKPTATLHKKTPLFISGFVGLRSTEERAFPVAIYDRLLRSVQINDDPSSLPITKVPEIDEEDEPGAQLSFRTQAKGAEALFGDF